MITDKISVSCPTQEAWDEVVQLMLDHGNVWVNDDVGVCEEKFNKYKENTRVLIGCVVPGTISKGHGEYQDLKCIEYEEFIRKYKIMK
ncbi:hypothetical protein KKH82_06005 [Patescibacteria group bacterium]|nr:hypothetical protein [Patescibacteria group bacterium]